MAESKDKLTRREALKGLTVGAGVIATLPVLGASVAAQDHQHMHTATQAAAEAKPQPLRREGNPGLTSLSVEALGGRVLRASIDEVSHLAFRAHLSLGSGSREVRTRDSPDPRTGQGCRTLLEHSAS